MLIALGVTLWMGANDLFAILDNDKLTAPQRTQALRQVVANNAKFVRQIGGMGAKHLLMVTIPDLGKIPHYTTKGAAAARKATAVTKQFNNLLTEHIKTVAKDEKIVLKIFHREIFVYAVCLEESIEFVPGLETE